MHIVLNILSTIKNLEEREKILRKILCFYIGNEYDSLRFHNFYNHRKNGKELINYHARLVVDVCREYAFPTINEHAEKIKNMLLFPFNFTFLVSSNPKDYGHVLRIDSRKGMDDYFSEQVVSEDYFMAYTKLGNNFYDWNK